MIKTIRYIRNSDQRKEEKDKLVILKKNKVTIPISPHFRKISSTFEIIYLDGREIMKKQDKRELQFQWQNSTQELVVTALFIALTYVATWLINIRLPLARSGGLIHLGNVPLFIAAMLFGRKTGALTGAIGMGLFDLLSGWTLWAPFTFVIVGLMGYVTGWFAEKRPTSHGVLYDVLALEIALVIKIAGYYIAEVILYHNWISPIGSVPGNILQVGTAAVIVLGMLPLLRGIRSRMLAPVMNK